MEATEALVFIHIPKTGGMTMERLISRQYPKPLTRWISLQRPAQVSAFLAMSEEERARLRCLMGHIQFGYHRHLPQETVYITLLREPMARFVSEYHHLSRHPRPGAWRPPDAAMANLAS